MPDARYPIGEWNSPPSLSEVERQTAIAWLRAVPEKLARALRGLNDQQLDTPYRDGGWTLRQVAHHLPDSHLNCYMRFKLGLTEIEPTIRPYDEKAWALLPDITTPIESSLTLLRALHIRMVHLLEALDEEAWSREFINPESGRYRIDQLLSVCAWHGRHHIAQITALRERKGW